jgi:RimJ/RimL family protein N-acetyltransferase
VLATERLVLRPPAADDLPFLLEDMNTPAVMEFLGGEIRTPDQVRESLDADIAAFASEGGHQRWTVWRREDGRRVGRCGLFHVRSGAAPEALRGQREIGWTLAPHAWGLGYATEAARAVLDYAYHELGLAIVYSQTSDSNAASTRVMQRLGFARRSELDYVDPDYPARDNPTTVWSLGAEDRNG